MSQAISDRYGLPLSTSSPVAAEHYVEAIDAIISQTYGAGRHLGMAVGADDGFALGHATLALASMFGYDPVKAKGHLADTHARAKGLSRREEHQIAVIDTWINGNSPRALELIREHFKDFPRDIVLLRLAQRLFVAGCSGSGVAHYPPDFYAMMKGIASHYGDDWAFQGQFAWATHEMGMLDEGLRLAQRSLELRPTNAVAAHSVAHVFYERADHSSGADFLGEWLKGYDRRIAYHVHLSWHQALFQLGMGRYQQVAALYENDIRPSVTACDANSLADSASLMWRWFLYTGSYSPFPWAEVRDQADAAVQNPGLPFRDGHAAMAFAAAGDEDGVARVVEGWRAMANNGNALAAEAALPLMEGISAFAQGDYAQSAALLKGVQPQLPRIGGSHAQHEVFEDTLLEAYLRAEQYDDAQTLLQARLSRRASVRDEFWLGRAQSATHQPAATDTLASVRERWQTADVDSPEVAALEKVAGG